MSNFIWPVMPLCLKQQRDVDPKDILSGGLYRKCDVYKSGGGYDKFPDIYEKYTRMSKEFARNQFVVQLKGCPLKCPYCYVTPDGINGKSRNISTEHLVSHFNRSGCDVFHLMGGAPALYLEHWKELHHRVPVFHSDFLLIEKEYQPEWLIGLKGIHAVSIKSYSMYSVDQYALLEKNLKTLLEFTDNCWLYFTFTDTERWLKEVIMEVALRARRWEIQHFDIELIDYEALK